MSADEALNFSDALNSDHRPRRVGSARLEKEAEVSVAKERAAASLTPLRLRPS